MQILERKSAYHTPLRILLSACLAAFLFSGCKLAQPPETSKSSHQDGEDASAANFIRDDMFSYSPDVVKGITETEAASMISASNFFYFSANQTTSSSETASEDQDFCAVKRDQINNSSDGSDLVMSYMYDDRDCLSGGDLPQHKMTVMIRISCSETDLSKYVGGRARAYLYTRGAIDFCPDDAVQKTIINADYTVKNNQETARSYGGLMQSDGNPCVVKKNNGLIQNTGCVFYQRIDKTAAGEQNLATTKLLRFETKDLSASSKGRYYGSGTMELRINNWTGTMTYSRDNVAPTYKINNTAKTVDGSFQAGIFKIQ